jgi:hypothetical protein
MLAMNMWTVARGGSLDEGMGHSHVHGPAEAALSALNDPDAARNPLRPHVVISSDCQAFPPLLLQGLMSL